MCWNNLFFLQSKKIIGVDQKYGGTVMVIINQIGKSLYALLLFAVGGMLKGLEYIIRLVGNVILQVIRKHYTPKQKLSVLYGCLIAVSAYMSYVHKTYYSQTPVGKSEALYNLDKAKLTGVVDRLAVQYGFVKEE